MEFEQVGPDLGEVTPRPSSSNPVVDGSGHETRYYTDLGMACDMLLRCFTCRRLVTEARIAKHNCCRCGSSKYTEITTLSGWEMFLLWTGIINFPYRKQMLKEFGFEAWW